MEKLKERANMYHLIKTAFCPPDETLVASIVVGEFSGRIQSTVDRCCSLTAKCCLAPDLMEEISGLSQPMTAGIEQRAFLEALQTEYMRLFVTAFPVLWAPAYESYYMEKKAMGKPAVDCLALYREEGLVLNAASELPDHIVTQLEYLHFLNLAAMEAGVREDHHLVQIYKVKQHKFYEGHIMNWVPEFCDRIQSHSEIDFYRVMSRLLKNFILLENRSLDAEKLDRFEEVG